MLQFRIALEVALRCLSEGGTLKHRTREEALRAPNDWNYTPFGDSASWWAVDDYFNSIVGTPVDQALIDELADDIVLNRREFISTPFIYERDGYAHVLNPWALAYLLQFGAISFDFGGRLHGDMSGDFQLSLDDDEIQSFCPVRPDYKDCIFKFFLPMRSQFNDGVSFMHTSTPMDIAFAALSSTLKVQSLGEELLNAYGTGRLATLQRIRCTASLLLAGYSVKGETAVHTLAERQLDGVEVLDSDLDDAMLSTLVDFLRAMRRASDRRFIVFEPFTRYVFLSAVPQQGALCVPLREGGVL
jgi:hypothetical protein